MISGRLRWQQTDDAPGQAKSKAGPDVAPVALTRDAQADAT
jgi:hypothetical protein